jgi:hypothetical protein
MLPEEKNTQGNVVVEGKSNLTFWTFLHASKESVLIVEKKETQIKEIKKKKREEFKK